MAYMAAKGENWMVVVDGKAGVEYESIHTLIFSSDGILECLATKGGVLYRVKYILRTFLSS
jgi:hypothetical protein